MRPGGAEREVEVEREKKRQRQRKGACAEGRSGGGERAE